MKQHTPGEWSVSELGASGEKSTDYIFIEPGVAVIERKIAGQDQHDMADARLLSAAKDMLASLLMVREVAIDKRGDDFNLSVDQWAQFHAAIAKATGSEVSHG